MLIREGFKKIISFETDMHICGEAKNGYEVLDSLRRKPCDVLVLDINMPDKNGLELLPQIKMEFPGLKVLMLSMNPEERFAIRALKSGASGYLSKDFAGEELVNAIHKVNSGRKYISPEVAELLAAEFDNDKDDTPHTRLSDREFQVFMLLGAGKAPNDIVEDLNISLSTVNTYRRRILEKMKLKTNADLIHYAIKNNLVD